MPSSKPIQQLDIPLIGGPLDGNAVISYDPPMLDFEWWGNWESQKHLYMLAATARGHGGRLSVRVSGCEIVGLPGEVTRDQFRRTAQTRRGRVRSRRGLVGLSPPGSGLQENGQRLGTA